MSDDVSDAPPLVVVQREYKLKGGVLTFEESTQGKERSVRFVLRCEGATIHLAQAEARDLAEHLTTLLPMLLGVA